MDNVHGAHGAPGIVEHPLLVQVDKVGDRRVAVQLVHDVFDDRARVVAVRRNAALRKIVKVVRVENIEGLELPLEVVHNGREDAHQQGEERQDARHV